MTVVVLIALAGSIGALSRFVLDGYIRAWLGRTFPWATLIINGSGSLLLGFVTGLMLRHQNLSTIGTIVGTGFCGGYTTFSTASFETVRLMEERRLVAALANTLGTLFMTLIGAGIGLLLAQIS
jgi:CrcB protein